MSETGPSVRRIRRLALLGGIVAGLSLLLALKGAGDANRLVGASDREEARTVSDVVLQALVQDAQVRRDQRSDSDPSYTKRVDAELNEERINVLFYGYGESHEPPLNERVIIGSVTIASIDTRDTRLNDVALVSLTHDIRAPEIERYLRKKGDYDGYPVKIDKAPLQSPGEISSHGALSDSHETDQRDVSFRSFWQGASPDYSQRWCAGSKPLRSRAMGLYLEGTCKPTLCCGFSSVHE